MMKRETKRRIAYYQDALPDMKKRVFAAALMLMIAVIVSITATYAWVTLSVAPVVSSVNTTMSANGALEIALSPDDGSQPQEYDIDESIAVSTDDVTVSNLRWGNLINLSDSAYGIDKLALRPAVLNDTPSERLSNPLKGGVYGADGRVSELNSNFAYAKWNAPFFRTSDEYGVRAIGTFKMEIADESLIEYVEKSKVVDKAREKVNAAYGKVADNMSSVSGLLSHYVQNCVPESYGGSATEIAYNWYDVQDGYELCNLALQAMYEYKDALVKLANFQRYVAGNKIELTWDDLAGDPSSYEDGSNDVSLVGLTNFVADLAKVEKSVSLLEAYYKEAEAGTLLVYWNSFKDADGKAVSREKTLDKIFTEILQYESMEINLATGSGENYVSFKKITGSVGSYVGDLLGLDRNETEVRVNAGILKDFEQLAVDSTYRLREKGAFITVNATASLYGISKTVRITGLCETVATGPSSFAETFTAAKNQDLTPTDAMIEDTYGMAVDFWLRTNAEETYLTLEGAVVTDENGDIYSYDGVNRVWGSTGEALVTTNSTTQGGGSCYIYYADTPEDKARSLELLESMKVAFIDSEGNLLSVAAMDTQNHYAVNGRITVPLILESGTTIDGTETTEYFITQMTHDDPRRITAIVYLEGDSLTNEHVLAAAAIDGQLNIQFGSSTELDTLGDSKLEAEERTVTATVTPTEIDYDVLNKIATVTVNVEGTEPRTVTAFFVREINATQGERQQTVSFTKQAGGTETSSTWTANYLFETPGRYYLRHVQLNGVEYALETPCSVVVKGFDISKVSLGSGSNQVIYTAAPTYSETVSVQFASDNAADMPTKVSARFIDEEEQPINVDLRYDATSATWKGEYTFQRAGKYTLQYLVLDEEYTDVSEYNCSLDLHLGLYVDAEPEKPEDLVSEYAKDTVFKKKIYVEIFDNADNEVENLSDAKLFYFRNGNTTDTRYTNLTWNEGLSKYVGELSLDKAGVYQFGYVSAGTAGRLDVASKAPTYTIQNAATPSYISAESMSVAKQYALFTTKPSDDIAIGPIAIKDSSSAYIAVVLKNTDGETTREFTLYNHGNSPLVYEASENEDTDVTYWKVRLPAYDENTANEATDDLTQRGTWTVEKILLWECYDTNNNYIDSMDHAVTWEYDFTALETYVCSDVKVSMTAGTTALGGSNTPFMSPQYVKDTNLSVQITDSDGDPVPAAAFLENPAGVVLNVRYDGNTDTKYGYTVDDDAGDTYEIKLRYEDGNWVVGDNTSWRYVGEYKPQSLTLTGATGASKVFEKAIVSGMPEKYTVTSAAPTSGNLKVGEWNQNGGQPNEFGGDSAGARTKEFLDTVNPNVMVKMKLVYKVGETEYTATHAAMPERLSVKLIATYVKDGTHPDGYSKEYGSYTWTTNDGQANDYESISTDMSRSGSKYDSISTTMLAGKYSLKLSATLDGTAVDMSDINDQLQVINVYSKSPTVTMALDETTPEACTVNRDAGINVSSNTFTAENIIAKNGKRAIVFISYEPFTKENNKGYYHGNLIGDQYATGFSETYANYSVPKVIFTLANAGNCTNFLLSIPNNNGVNVTFTGNGASAPTPIGWIVESSETHNEYCSAAWDERPFSYKTETPHTIDTQKITEITGTVDHTDSDGNKQTVTYTLTLSDPIEIVQENEDVPGISFAAVNYSSENCNSFSFAAQKNVQKSQDGDSFSFKLPAANDPYYLVNQEYFDFKTTNGWGTGAENADTKYAVHTGTEYDAQPGSGRVGWGDYKYSYRYKYSFDTYAETTITYTQTETADVYDAQYGLVGWQIGETTYKPGETCEVTDPNTVAIPIIGVQDKVLAQSNASVQRTKVSFILKKTTGTSTYSAYGDWESSFLDGLAKNAAKETLDAEGYTYSGHLPAGHTGKTAEEIAAMGVGTEEIRSISNWAVVNATS